MHWAHNQLSSMYATFIVEEEREKSSICPDHSVILQMHIISGLHYSTKKVLKSRTEFQKKTEITWSHWDGKLKDKDPATLISIHLEDICHNKTLYSYLD